MRDNKWLKKQLDFLLKTYFTDVKVTNPIEIKFGREAKFRFGAIRLVKKGITSGQGTTSITSYLPRLFKARGTRDTHGARATLKASETPAKSLITITSMFAKESVPEKVVLYTVAHELCHYAHGFSSTNRQLFRFPHHGGVVNRELENRGAQHLTRSFKSWLREYRKKILTGRTEV